MKLRNGLAALTVLALSLPSLRASATKADPFEQADDAPKSEAPAPAEPAEETAKPATKGTTSAAPGEAMPPLVAESPPPANPYVPLAPPPGPMRLENPSASIQFGILLQPQLEVAGSPDAELTTKNLFLRRTRFIAAGTLFKYFEFFFDTDWPNLDKLDNTDTMAGTVKNAPGMNIQDAFATGKPFGDYFMIDAGFMLPPLSHNSLESAAKLYAGDYFANSFRRNLTGQFDPFGTNGQNPVGRDTGFQVRGLVAGGHIEYRAGMFQGFRVSEMPGPPAMVGGLNFFRVAARLQINLLDPEPGFFHAGTYLGAKKVVSFGGFYDFQKQYKYFGGDVFVDLPAGPGVFTLQGDAGRWDGGTFIMGLPKQTVIMVEGGYLYAPAMTALVGEYERLVGQPLIADPTNPGGPLIPNPSNPSENRIGGGLAFYPFGYNSNIKAFYARVHRDPATHDFNQINVQWQVYLF
jgi:hypothetical protein